MAEINDEQKSIEQGEAEPSGNPVPYYPIQEEMARRAKEMMSFSDYKPGSATAEYRRCVDRAVEIAEVQKRKVDPIYHEKINTLVEAYARRLAANMNRQFEIDSRVPSVLIAGTANFPVRKKEKQNAASARNMEEWQEIEGLLDRIRGTGTSGIRSDHPRALEQLEEKLKKRETIQQSMKEVNAYYRKHHTLEGCNTLSAEEVEKLKEEMARPWHIYEAPYPPYMLSNNSAEIRRLKSRIEELKRHAEIGFIGWEFAGGRAVPNQENNRLQLFFEEKPSAEERYELKHNGFRWAPKEEAWQRQLNMNAIHAAGRIACIKPLTGQTPYELQPKAVKERSTKEDPSL